MDWVFQSYIFTFILISILVVSFTLLVWYKLSARGWTIFRLGWFDLGAITHELLFENIGDGVVVLDQRNCLVSFNPAAQRYFNLSDQLKDREFKLALSGESQTLSLPLDAESYQQVELIQPGPPPVYLDARIFPLYRSDKQLIGRMIITRDITTTKQFENALFLLNTEMEFLIRKRTNQLENLVHSLKKEVNERRQAEASLRGLQENMAQRIADQSRKMAALYEVMMLYGQLLETSELVEQCLGEINAVAEAASVGLYQWYDETRQLRLTAHWGLSASARRCLEILPPAWLPDSKTPKTILGPGHSEPALAGIEIYLGAPIHLRTQVIGVLALFWAEPRTFSVEDFALFNILADQLGLILENDRLREIGREAAALHERQRLARELHDSVTQSLHSLTLLADTAVYILPQQKPERLESLLHQLAVSARQSLKEMRLLLYHLQPATDSKELVELLTLRLDNVERRAGIDAQLTVTTETNWPSTWNEAIFRIALEALNNALKHSRANAVFINLRSHGQEVVLEVTDNGCGFDLEQKRGGMGLQNMLRRAEQLGGRLIINSKPGQGTRLCLKIQQKNIPDALAVEKLGDE